MERKSTCSKFLAGLLSLLICECLIAGCSQTAAPDQDLTRRAGEAKPALPPPSGFLGPDYSLLKPAAPGSDQRVMLAYTNTKAAFTSYDRLMIAPVTFWADDASKVSASDQQLLCNYFYNQLRQDLGKNLTLVNQPGQGVVKLTVALTDATAATPELRSVSVLVPQAHVLSLIKDAPAETYSFVGSATGEAKLTDSLSGELLAAWADQRFGTAAVSNAGLWKWSDAESAMRYWSDGLAHRLIALGVQHSASPAAAD